VKGKEGGHAGIPVSDPVPLFSKDLILYVKTPASGADVGTGAAIDARKGHFFPEGRIEKLGYNPLF
jgi:hypothetical protein